VARLTPRVWELQWNSTSQSYYWTDETSFPMGRVFSEGSTVAAVPDTFLAHIHQP